MNTIEKKYKSYVGPVDNYDRVGAMQFNLHIALGLRQNNSFLDIGCGSLRAGKLFIPFLLKGNYVGIEPNNWLVEEGIKKEIGNNLIEIKQPEFYNFSNFQLSEINREFDFINAQSIFSHTSIQQINTCLAEVKKVLAPNGLFAATFVQGKENYKGTEWVYPDCVTYTMSKIEKLASLAELNVLKVNWDHPNNQTWFLFYHPYNKINLKKKARNIHSYYKRSFINKHDINLVKRNLLAYKFVQKLNDFRKKHFY